MSSCRSCLSLAGKHRISPGRTLHAGVHWVLEHAYPVAVRGWLVVVLKRHAEALHELTEGELAELFIILRETIALVREKFGCEKEYFACFAEGEGFKHLHVHVIPKTVDVPEEYRGPRVFSLLHLSERVIPPEDIIRLCEELRTKFDMLPPSSHA